jgi:hypothetical protein
VIKEVPVEYVGKTPTVPSYLSLDPTLVGNAELATDFDYVFYDQSYLVKPKPQAKVIEHGDIRRALFNREWDRFTGHSHAAVGESMNSPIVIQSDNILYFAAPLFTAYRDHDYWVYREILKNALRKFLGRTLIQVEGPGWVEFTLHQQTATDHHPERKIVHIVAFHSRRSFQRIPHVDQGWMTSGLRFKVRADNSSPKRVYLASNEEELPFEIEDGYVVVSLPPIGVYAVVVIEQ